MGSFSGLGIGLSFLFGCILVGLVAEVYYLHWKKRISKAEHESFSSPCIWKMYAFFLPTRPREASADAEMGSGKKLEMEMEESGLKKLESFIGFPRYLFTITEEESGEDLEESNHGKSSRKGSEISFGTPFLTPLSSPAFSVEAYSRREFNPLFEVAAELSRLRSSPPPTFQFLRDAEDKLLRKLLAQEAEMRLASRNEGPQKQQNLQLVPPLVSSSPEFVLHGNS